TPARGYDPYLPHRFSRIQPLVRRLLEDERIAWVLQTKHRGCGDRALAAATAGIGQIDHAGDAGPLAIECSFFKSSSTCSLPRTDLCPSGALAMAHDRHGNSTSPPLK